MFVEYIRILVWLYFIFSLAISLIGGYTYREVLTHPVQILALVFIYWWPPMFRMYDMEGHNNSIN